MLRINNIYNLQHKSRAGKNVFENTNTHTKIKQKITKHRYALKVIPKVFWKKSKYPAGKIAHIELNRRPTSKVTTIGFTYK